MIQFLRRKEKKSNPSEPTSGSLCIKNSDGSNFQLSFLADITLIKSKA